MPPPALLRAIDAQAAKVLQLRDYRDDLESRARQLEHDAYVTRFEASLTRDRGLRKLLSDHADRLVGQAGTTRMELDGVQKSLAQDELALDGLHARARQSLRDEAGSLAAHGRSARFSRAIPAS
jgi:hypothetical protein